MKIIVDRNTSAIICNYLQLSLNFVVIKLMRLIALIFAIGYLTLSFKPTLTMHYCNDQLVDVNIFGNNASCNGDEGDCKMKCCETELLVLELDEEQLNLIVPSFDFSPKLCLIELFNVPLSEQVKTTSDFNFDIRDGPPDSSRPPIYKLTSSFIFYS